jgi:hypothetical protein
MSAECAACDGDGKGKQSKQGEGKEGFAQGHAIPLSMRRFKYATARAKREK